MKKMVIILLGVACIFLLGWFMDNGAKNTCIDNMQENHTYVGYNMMQIAPAGSVCTCIYQNQSTKDTIYVTFF